MRGSSQLAPRYVKVIRINFRLKKAMHMANTIPIITLPPYPSGPGCWNETGYLSQMYLISKGVVWEVWKDLCPDAFASRTFQANCLW